MDFLYPHPDYNRVNHHNDIGLVVTMKPVTVNEWVKPIRIADESTLDAALVDQPDLPLNVSGFGGMDRLKTPAKVLRFATIRLQEMSVCFGNRTGEKDFPGHFCAGGERTASGIFRDSCDGDSGGPVTFM